MIPVPTTVDVGLIAVRDGLRVLLASVTALGGRVFWLQSPEQPTIPCAVIQSQDGGGSDDAAIGSVNWRGEIAVRIFATTRDDADTIAAAVLAAIPQSYTVATGAGAGVALTFRLRRPLVAPPAKTTHVAGWLFSVSAT